MSTGPSCSFNAIVSGFIPPLGISPSNRQSAKPLNPVSNRRKVKEPAGGEEPKLTRALPPQDGHAMSWGDELKLQ